MVRNLPAGPGDSGSIPGVGKIPWRRAWQPTPIFLPGGSHRQGSLAGYCPRDRQEPETTEPECSDTYGPELRHVRRSHEHSPAGWVTFSLCSHHPVCSQKLFTLPTIAPFPSPPLGFGLNRCARVGHFPQMESHHSCPSKPSHSVSFPRLVRVVTVSTSSLAG